MPATPKRGPLSGIKVIEMAGIGPCPFAAMVLADLGADVLRVERSSAVEDSPPDRAAWDVLQRGKRSVGIDLKAPEGVRALLDLVERADVLLEGFRPGVTERLGVGPEDCLARNRRLIYGRMTGWGQEGPLSSHAGHDIDYISLAGVLGGIGRQGDAPLPPCNLVGDFGGGGMLLALGVVAGLLSASCSGEGQVVDAAMVDGAALLWSMMWSFRALGVWREERGTNLLDTGAPYYETYECLDGGFVAVGALEPKFYAALCRVMELSPADLPPQMDRESWPELKKKYAAIFRQRSRDEWVALAAAEGGDACLAPVLSMTEATAHPHNVARGTFLTVDGVLQPAPAPRFSRTPATLTRLPCRPGEGGREALIEWGIDPSAVAALLAAEVVRVL
ncbi:MAG: CaiB/BaiF CoA transferase family protein [Acidimicrobiales bacterium]